MYHIRKWLLFIVVILLGAESVPLFAEESDPQLNGKGWTAAVRSRLEALLAEHAEQRQLVVFDFDNTVLCGDIGEATFETLVRSGVISPESVPRGLVPCACR